MTTNKFRPDDDTIRRLWKYAGNYVRFQILAEQKLGRRPGLATVFRWLQHAGISAKDKTSVHSDETHAKCVSAGQNIQELPREEATKESAEPVIVQGEVLAPDACRGKLTGKRYVFTCAQNNTEVHEPFLKSLLNFCGHNDAQLVVGGITYNKTGFQNAHKESNKLAWDSRIEQYMLNQSMELAPDLVWCGEMNILPTAIRPLSGLESYCRHASGIVPHVKVAMDSVPRMKGYAPKFMYTTGAVTRRNYIEQRAGLRAAFHHVFGALYVEIDKDGDWFARQLIAGNDGCFYDLTVQYTPDGVKRGQTVMAVNLGDLHAECVDKKVSRGIDYILNTLRPQYLFLHDIGDFRARNHHNIDDPYIRALATYERKKNAGKATINDSVGAGLCAVADRLVHLAGQFHGELVVVHSNHDDMLTRWLKEADYRADPLNAITFLNLQQFVYTMLADGHMPGTYSLLGHVLGTHLRDAKDRVRFLLQDESFRICETAPGEGIECGMHGHLGANGRRGRPVDFTRLGCKCNTGHTHSAGIIDGVYTAGVSCPLDMGYNKGATSWSHSHIVTYHNGKRCIITQRGSKWKA